MMKDFRPYLQLLAVSLLVLACSSEKIDQEERARVTVQGYYEQLFRGDYESFVAGTYTGADSLPADYKSQLLLNARMYVERIQNEHGGVSSVTAIRARLDTLKSAGGASGEAAETIVAQTYISLAFADSTKEEIVTPMVLHGDVWYLR